ncbi:putative membrane protein [Nocardiopsis alba ATCC BAA-2165]|uniref:Putative membrane protein n=1 Tax=Nocardiopsis alba (strain ATCC BAA-2165 / BE74) TaxID=1205910 RepID=J7L7A9_NOCAA|nr:putative membrane protein [Nocardiopsis alba ATCC BAA-2165]
MAGRHDRVIGSSRFVMAFGVFGLWGSFALVASSSPRPV